MAGFFYYLAAHPRVYRKLQGLLSEAFPDGDGSYTAAAAVEIPYVDAIINETMRLQPPASINLTRTTPAQGLTIDGVYIPGDITVSVATYAIHRDPRYFARPLEFIPERWTEQPKLIKDARAFIPFSIGTVPPPLLALHSNATLKAIQVRTAARASPWPCLKCA
jgi:cytochrome P450